MARGLPQTLLLMALRGPFLAAFREMGPESTRSQRAADLRGTKAMAALLCPREGEAQERVPGDHAPWWGLLAPPACPGLSQPGHSLDGASEEPSCPPSW